MRTIILALAFVSVSVYAWSATILLKNGQTVTGDIIQQDETKAVLKVDGTPITYYMDEILSINGNKISIEKDSGAEKQKLAEQYMAFWPTSKVISDWVDGKKFTPDQRQAVLAALNSPQNILRLTRLRKQGLMKYLSTDDLKAIIHIYSSPGGLQFLNDFEQFRIHTMNNFFYRINKKANAALQGTKATNQNTTNPH